MENIDFSPMHDGDEVSRRAELAFGGPITVPVIPSPVIQKRNQVELRKGGVWSVQEGQVPVLPELHPLERTAVFIRGEDPARITERISGELRDRSIEAVYDDDIAKAKCTSQDGVDFRIRLYKGRGDYSNGTIVEVQRRFGVSMNFHLDTTAILDRALGKDVQRATARKNNLPLVSETDDDYKPDGSSSLKMVSKMLMGHLGYDTHHLGLETLSSLTDGAKMGKATARAVSKELLRSENEVGNKVLSHILDEKEEDETYKLRTTALTVLANAIQAVGGVVSDELREKLEPVLIQDLRGAEKNQRAAFQAARSVEFLLSVDKQNITDFDSALKIALEVGKVRYAALERQVQRCLDKITGGS